LFRISKLRGGGNHNRRNRAKALDNISRIVEPT
jgi:hypothetical protein